MGHVERVLDLLSKACVAVAGAGLVTLVVIFGWLVWGRYVMNDTPTWVEQVALLLVVWITFLGGAAGVQTQSHLSIEFVREMMPRWLRMPLHWMALAGMLVFGVVLFWQGWTLAESTWTRRVPMLGIPEGLRAVPMAICGALTALFTLQQAVALATGKD
ncbi:TRAP transporter small permease [Sagittula sp. NFXS13]